MRRKTLVAQECHMTLEWGPFDECSLSLRVGQREVLGGAAHGASLVRHLGAALSESEFGRAASGVMKGRKYVQVAFLGGRTLYVGVGAAERTLLVEGENGVAVCEIALRPDEWREWRGELEDWLQHL